jgi:hypothetical protein
MSQKRYFGTWASGPPVHFASASAPAGGYTAPKLAIISDLVTQEASLKADYASGNLSAAGQAQAAINSDISQLELLLAAGGVGLPTPSVTPAAA